jgi:hypothetical protein
LVRHTSLALRPPPHLPPLPSTQRIVIPNYTIKKQPRSSGGGGGGGDDEEGEEEGAGGSSRRPEKRIRAAEDIAVPPQVYVAAFFLMHTSHDISVTGGQGIPKYKLGLERGMDGRVGVGLVRVNGMRKKMGGGLSLVLCHLLAGSRLSILVRSSRRSL